MINNLEDIKNCIIKDTLPENNKDLFYMIEILKRKKENPGIKKDLVLKRYYLKHVTQLDEWMPDIIKLCEVFNARAVFHVNIKSEKKLAIDIMTDLASRFRYDEFDNVHRISDSNAASQTSAGQKYWILDIDNTNWDYNNKVLACIQVSDIAVILESPHGFHAIVKPFQKDTFCKAFPDIEIKKNNSTILYAI